MYILLYMDSYNLCTNQQDDDLIPAENNDDFNQLCTLCGDKGRQKLRYATWGILQGRIQDFSKGGSQGNGYNLLCINYIIYILQLFTLLF